MRICLITREEIYTYSIKENLSCYHLNAMLLKTLMRMHFITPYHIMHVSIYAFKITYFMFMHIGSSEGITLLEFNEEEEEHQEAPQPIALKARSKLLRTYPSAWIISQLLFSKASPGAF